MVKNAARSTSIGSGKIESFCLHQSTHVNNAAAAYQTNTAANALQSKHVPDEIELFF